MFGVEGLGGMLELRDRIELAVVVAVCGVVTGTGKAGMAPVEGASGVMRGLTSCGHSHWSRLANYRGFSSACILTALPLTFSSSSRIALKESCPLALRP